jgi:hypothetical protein
MDLDNINGKMEECMLASINSIKNMELAHILGQTEESTQDNGLIVNAMEREKSYL